jgi:hypothetical protein
LQRAAAHRRDRGRGLAGELSDIARGRAERLADVAEDSFEIFLLLLGRFRPIGRFHVQPDG